MLVSIAAKIYSAIERKNKRAREIPWGSVWEINCEREKPRWPPLCRQGQICDECLQKETWRAEKMDGGRTFARTSRGAGWCMYNFCLFLHLSNSTCVRLIMFLVLYHFTCD